MEKILNPKSMDSQPIWLKSVSSIPDWLDLENPWLKEVIWIDPNLNFNLLYGELHPLSLSSTHVGSSGSSVVDDSLNKSMCQLNQPPNWLPDSVEAQFSFKSGIDGLSFSCSGLSPWDLRPPLGWISYFLYK